MILEYGYTQKAKMSPNLEAVNEGPALYSSRKTVKEFSIRWVDKFMEICAIIAADRQFGYKSGNLSRVNSMRGL